MRVAELEGDDRPSLDRAAEHVTVDGRMRRTRAHESRDQHTEDTKLLHRTMLGLCR
jgi:hypothetical protein